MVAFVQLAHGVSIGREDLPIPVELFNLGAAVVLILSFLGLAVLWRRPQLQEPRERTVAQLPRRPLAILSGLAGVGLFGLLVYFGLFAGLSPLRWEAGRLPSRATASWLRATQYWMLTVMVGFTSLALYLLSA